MANANFRVIEEDRSQKYAWIKEAAQGLQAFQQSLEKRKKEKMKLDTIKILSMPDLTPEQKRQTLIAQADRLSEEAQNYIEQAELELLYNLFDNSLAEQRRAQADYYNARTAALNNPQNMQKTSPKPYWWDTASPEQQQAYINKQGSVSQSAAKDIPTQIINIPNPDDNTQTIPVLINKQTGEIIENVSAPFKQPALASLNQAGQTIDQVANTPIPQATPEQIKQDYLTRLGQAQNSINQVARFDVPVPEPMHYQPEQASATPATAAKELDEQTAMQIYQEALKQTGGNKEKAKELARQIAKNQGYKI